MGVALCPLSLPFSWVIITYFPQPLRTSSPTHPAIRYILLAAAHPALTTLGTASQDDKESGYI